MRVRWAFFFVNRQMKNCRYRKIHGDTTRAVASFQSFTVRFPARGNARRCPLSGGHWCHWTMPVSSRFVKWKMDNKKTYLKFTQLEYTSYPPPPQLLSKHRTTLLKKNNGTRWGFPRVNVRRSRGNNNTITIIGVPSSVYNFTLCRNGFSKTPMWVSSMYSSSGTDKPGACLEVENCFETQLMEFGEGSVYKVYLQNHTCYTYRITCLRVYLHTCKNANGSSSLLSGC